MGLRVVWVIALLLAGCGGGGSQSPTPVPSLSLPQYTAYFSVVQSDLLTPATRVTIYANLQPPVCATNSSNCNSTLTTDQTGRTNMMVFGGAAYCVSLHNPSVSLANAPASPTYFASPAALVYMVTDGCLKMPSDLRPAPINLAE